MHGFYIYEKVAARDLGWIQVFSGIQPFGHPANSGDFCTAPNS
jgi:hypothetical protein